MRAGVLLLLIVVPLGCSNDGQSGRGGSETCCPCPTGAGQQRVLDGQLMALLSSARAYHHQADILVRQGQLDAAIAKVRAILALDLDSRWPEAEEVRVDATARLAKLMLRAGHGDAALRLVDAELAKKLRPSFYQANLYSVRGELLEARVKRLDGEGQKERAKEIAREAMSAFERSIRINKALQRELEAKRKGPATTGGGR